MGGARWGRAEGCAGGGSVGKRRRPAHLLRVGSLFQRKYQMPLGGGRSARQAVRAASPMPAVLFQETGHGPWPSLFPESETRADGLRADASRPHAFGNGVPKRSWHGVGVPGPGPDPKWGLLCVTSPSEPLCQRMVGATNTPAQPWPWGPDACSADHVCPWGMVPVWSLGGLVDLWACMPLGLFFWVLMFVPDCALMLDFKLVFFFFFYYN